MLRWFFTVFFAAAFSSCAQVPVVPAPFPAPSPTAKRVEIDKTHQVLRAYEGDNLVFQTRISTSKWDRFTPNGDFTAGGKERIHYSKLFHNAPMPFAVEVVGDVFIHGFATVPRHPASHGCIRVPIDGNNPAKQFYEWIERGTPISIIGHWEDR